ncbi:hydroxyacylglutathione hydrolase [bacterium (Candidatus Blackallbacteria) CG17_big_fil_post_rev_8_21_14_2_50_48_46]|uniref:Hydroxyacylglutathione hydrolase n=1 Tax=bacterium (Candidatus Blackallbacteria) CG17_big_fil_post_rev_8_21_14_2_50_48_46 TaxID=2014261 RepID=A0A2M7GAN2_9BACT|nr:MAG: hydroxyacylglutathione hydrolase [bacterium (Candidatus Blackallbacteria) CG18_big_fil_WC_8_21_14_2_50_49_26]PIW19211.1 MAG: hydroxyacylglutathione hydrolase [bacterium (Candidatus Blackallbacteria) CG17_big_fil_post_rev_8_21_14_2_50_48_46]PIW45439.1 MAG: hydroxyacylglutathione hydrolase [bacterium (Candidatus Blackallbacteria) CG13_big_fil_rev_8_21_14_2_50_49_14]
MQIIPVPCLKDNFAYLILNQHSEALMVDPSESQPLIDALAQYQARPLAILNTHHHWDHTGGNAGLLEVFPELEVYAHASDQGRIPGQTHFLEGGDLFQLAGFNFRVLFNPGHTLGAVSYAVGQALFTGDTLFAAGCGRIFEGTPAQMYHSLNQIIGACPLETELYFGHEYTTHNLEFALEVEPLNSDIQARLEATRAARQQGHFSTPSTLRLERKTNPFLRCEEPAVIAFTESVEPGRPHTPEDIFRVLRAVKDRF